MSEENCENYDAERLLQRVYKQLHDLADYSDDKVDVNEIHHVIETIEVNRPRDEDTAGDPVGGKDANPQSRGSAAASEHECPSCGDPTHFEEWPGKEGKMCSECGYEETSEKSGELEPVAHVHQYGDLCMHKSAYERLQDKLDEGPHGFTDVYDDCDDRVETWVRLSDVEEWFAEILYQVSMAGNTVPDTVQEYLARKRRELREFTQQSKGGSTE